jgi:hypothetical protein
MQMQMRIYKYELIDISINTELKVFSLEGMGMALKPRLALSWTLMHINL